MAVSLSRRAACAGLAAAWCAGPAVAQDVPARYSAIQVDVGPLYAKGLGPYAGAVRATLGRALATEFGPAVGGRSARLVVRIDAISLRSYVGPGRSGIFGTNSQTDYLEGEALVIGPRGEVVSRLPQLSAVPSSSGGAYYLPDAEERRLFALTAHFAGWLKRRLG